MTLLQAYDRSRVKLAELGGDGQDIPFEQAFSNLAHAYLRDKAPSLLDHEQGFQLLDRNQENTKAIGVFGFKVGSHQLFAPVFFLQGDLKGHELLYLKNQDLFVPLKENWLNYILNRKPNILGESTGRSTAQIGVQQPDLQPLGQSPYKYASAVAPWCREIMPKIAATALTDTKAELAALGRGLSLPEFTKRASLQAVEWLVNTCMRFPKIGQAVAEFHGLDFLNEAVKHASARARQSVLDGPSPQRRRQPQVKTGSVLDRPPIQHPIKTGALKIVHFDATIQTEVPKGLTEEDQEKLLRDAVLIKDDRSDEEVSVPYKTQTEQKLFNPQETGLYEVLVKPGDFERCFVVVNPHGPSGRKNWATVVRVGDDANWLNCHPTRIWCNAKIEGKEYDDWFKGLPEATSLSKGDSRYIIIGQRGHATLPFKVTKSIGDGRESNSYEVDFSDYCGYRYAESILTPQHRNQAYYEGDWHTEQSYDKWEDGQRVHLDAKDGTQMRSSRGDLYIPTGCKLLTAKRSASDADAASRSSKNEPIPYTPGGDGRSDPPPIKPGNLLDAELGIMTKTSAFKIAGDPSDFSINNGPMRPPLTTLIELVGRHGFREKTARELMRRAAGGKVFRCRVKYAEPYMIDEGPTAPAIPEPAMGGYNEMGWPGPTQAPQELGMPVPDMSAQMTDPSVYDPSPEAVGDPMADAAKMEEAAATGQKEIFDTAMIGSMLKAVRDDTMVDRYLPELIKGMDRLGRVLFMFYWHGDKFADRYGKQDMPELEDSLRNAFEMVGDVILFLKQKTIEPYPEEAGTVEMELGDTAEA